MKIHSKYPPTPTLDRMKQVRDQSQVIGEFLEWMQSSETPYVIGQYNKYDELVGANISIEKLLAQFLGIDLAKAEEERRAVLEWHRKETNQAAK